MSLLCSKPPIGSLFHWVKTGVLLNPSWLCPPTTNCLSVLFSSYILLCWICFSHSNPLMMFKTISIFTLGDFTFAFPLPENSWSSIVPSLLTLNLDHILAAVWGLTWQGHLKLQIVLSNTPNSPTLSFFLIGLHLALSHVLIVCLSPSVTDYFIH